MVEKQAQAMVSQSRGGTGDPLLGAPRAACGPIRLRTRPRFCVATFLPWEAR